MANGRLWTEKEKQVIRDMYPDHFASEIAQILGRTASQVQQCAAKLGVKASAERIARSGRMSSQHPNVIASQFKKGTVPPNKGKKMSAELYARCAPTMFKKGHAPVNHRTVGSERVNVEGYVEVKVAEPNRWRLKHRVVWEAAYGEIPRGYNIQFRNGNRQDLRLENLYMISRAEQCARENSFHARYPEELKAVIRLKGAIKRQITNIRKRKEKK